MKKALSFCILSLSVLVGVAPAQNLATMPDDPYFADFKPLAAPATTESLQKGDRLAIIGDSITEQKMYSRIMETYLTACVPQLEVSVRQFGWGGEKANGFCNRMENDCLRFKPTIATTCYGMNDHRYEAYKPEIGDEYYRDSTTIVTRFKEAGTRVVQGSPGMIGLKPWWQNNPESTLPAMNKNLCELRNIGIKIAGEQNVAFADVFLPMFIADFQARKMYGDEYKLAGEDGVHPDWAGHLVMAYAFLKSLGLDGDLAQFTIDLKDGSINVSEGHKVLSKSADKIVIESSRYPFCAAGELNSFKTIRSGMTLVPFNQELNRFMLKAKNATASSYKVIWGDQSRSYTGKQLEEGINLAADFEVNPFSAAFKKVDEAVAHKQNYETHQIKSLFHGDEGIVDMEATVSLSERARQLRLINLRESFKPVVHTLSIIAE
ncbi:MAG: SGNH/GDSL hydrolase family protein [Sedimentisphaerales bacterium]|nr:SGNH/GDSL hydrolase family protein [Sedimentisphaerales bacterium]MBN2841795.1 SGNH/GDSL hydrolase family protein [Sedimentisphaerales bacterium]